MANVIFPNSCPVDSIEHINGYAVPPIPRTRPFKALISIFRILKDIDETKYVYELFQAVSGKSYRDGFTRFSNSEYGKKVLDHPIKIEEILSQKEWLQNLPAGSVGRCYYNMMKDKSFSVDGLLVAAKHAGIDVSEPTTFEAFRRYFIHFEVSHDLWHVLSGYDTDPLGEICLLEFYRAQWPDAGLRMLTFLGGISMKIENLSHRKDFKGALKEGYESGLKSKDIQSVDIKWMLSSQLRDVRKALNIPEPKIYRSIPYSVKSGLRGGTTTNSQQLEPVFETGWS